MKSGIIVKSQVFWSRFLRLVFSPDCKRRNNGKMGLGLRLVKLTLQAISPLYNIPRPLCWVQKILQIDNLFVSGNFSIQSRS